MNFYEDQAREKKRELDELWKMTKITIWGCLIAMFLGLSSCKGWDVLSDPYTDKQTVKATLELAYEYNDRCGKSRYCSKYMGRFKEEATGEMWNRNIEGWNYHSFVQNGRKPEPGWTLQISQIDRGKKVPPLVETLAVFGFLLFVGGFIALVSFTINYGIEKDSFDTYHKRWLK